MKNNTKGSSMVSVIVAFVILMLGMGMVYTSIMFSKRLTSRAVQTRKETEDTMASYYQNTGTSEARYTKFTLTGDGTSVEVGGRYITYKTANNSKVYAFLASPGDGWHAADNIMQDFVVTDKTGGSALNDQLLEKYDPIDKNTFPPVSDEERAAAQHTIDRQYSDAGAVKIPQVPDGMVWKANVIMDEKTGKRSYYLWATTNTTGTTGWNAVLLCIDGQIYVSANANTVSVTGQGIAKYNQNYTKEQMIKEITNTMAFYPVY